MDNIIFEHFKKLNKSFCLIFNVDLVFIKKENHLRLIDIPVFIDKKFDFRDGILCSFLPKGFIGTLTVKNTQKEIIGTEKLRVYGLIGILMVKKKKKEIIEMERNPDYGSFGIEMVKKPKNIILKWSKLSLNIY